jgi:hypothetical protein
MEKKSEDIVEYLKEKEKNKKIEKNKTEKLQIIFV